MDQIKIGKFIASQRKQNNLTQKELATRLNVSDRSISKWENGVCMPDLSLFDSLCKELNISYNELLSGEKIENLNLIQENNLESMVRYSNQKNQLFIKKVIAIFIVFVICLFMFSNFWINNDQRFGGFLYLVAAIFFILLPFLSLKHKEWSHLITIISFIICSFFLLNEIHEFHYIFEKYQLWGIGDELIIDFGIVRLILLLTILFNCSVYLVNLIKNSIFK